MNTLALPWQLDEEARNGVQGCRTIEDCNGMDIAHTVGLANDEEDRVIAEHIIKSANAHGKMVLALHAAQYRLEELHTHYSGLFAQSIAKDIDGIKAALAGVAPVPAPMNRSTGLRCPVCCAKVGDTHASTCTRTGVV